MLGPLSNGGEGHQSDLAEGRRFMPESNILCLTAKDALISLPTAVFTYARDIRWWTMAKSASPVFGQCSGACNRPYASTSRNVILEASKKAHCQHDVDFAHALVVNLRAYRRGTNQLCAFAGVSCNDTPYLYWSAQFLQCDVTCIRFIGGKFRDLC